MEGIDDVIAIWTQFFDQRVKVRRDLTDGYSKYLRRLFDKNIPPIFELRHLALLIGVEQRTLAGFIANTNKYYRTFQIPKRSGGYRDIDVPVPDLLFIQRWILENILDRVEVSEAAHGFVTGRSIITNASAHLGQQMLLKLDLRSFFPSISFRRGISMFLRLGYPPNVSFFLASLCFKSGRLPQGAATSPALSNIVARRLDARLMGLAMKQGLRYTRYADDIIFSGESVESKILEISEKVINSEGFLLNDSKTHFVGPNQKKIITGISISNGRLALPRRAVRAIKQECHFLLKYGYFSSLERTGVYDPILIERLMGRISFWLQVDPDNSTAARLLADLRLYRDQLTDEVSRAYRSKV